MQGRLTKAFDWLKKEQPHTVIQVEHWKTKIWGENPADFGRK
jgi:hypothetical protein